jgi:hypothetical protein
VERGGGGALADEDFVIPRGGGRARGDPRATNPGGARAVAFAKLGGGRGGLGIRTVIRRVYSNSRSKGGILINIRPIVDYRFVSFEGPRIGIRLEGKNRGKTRNTFVLYKLNQASKARPPARRQARPGCQATGEVKDSF